MLVLSRKKNEDIIIGEGAQKVVVKVVDIIGDRVKLGFLAPDGLRIMRTEIVHAKQEKKNGVERPASRGPFYTF